MVKYLQERGSLDKGMITKLNYLFFPFFFILGSDIDKILCSLLDGLEEGRREPASQPASQPAICPACLPASGGTTTTCVTQLPEPQLLPVPISLLAYNRGLTDLVKTVQQVPS